MPKRFGFILITVLLLPTLFIVLAEGILYAFGYTSTYEHEDPFLGFRDVVPLFSKVTGAGTSFYRTRPSKLEWFNDEKFPARKGANEYRIFCFGGSTTYGRPYLSTTSFSNWLEVLLNASDVSERRYEVINVGGISYASYRIVNLMKEVVRYEPDLFIVYTGNNEFLEERTYGSIIDEPGAITWVRSQLNHLRTYSLARDFWRGSDLADAEEKFVMTGEVSPLLDQSLGLDRYHRDDRKAAAVASHFRSNLSLMADIAAGEGIDMLFVVPATNDGDFSPFRSEFSKKLTPEQSDEWDARYTEGSQALLNGDYKGALSAFNGLTAIDNEFADLRYRRGEALMGVVDYPAAKVEFEAARDLDVAPLRAITSLRNAVREVAGEKGISLFDFPTFLGQILEAKSGHRIPGIDFFYDHCHPTLEAHQMIAENIMAIVRKELPPFTETEWQDVDHAPLYDSVMATLNPAYHGLRDLNLAKVLRWAGKKEESAPFIRRAAKNLPTHPEAQYLLGLVFLESEQFDSAGAALTRAIDLDPKYAKAYNSLGSVHLHMALNDHAVDLFRRAIALDSNLVAAYYNLGNGLYSLGREDEAVAAYRKTLSLDPDHTGSLNNLGVVYMNRNAFDLAGPLFVRTTTLDPRNVEAFFNLGVIAFLQGSYRKSEEMFRTVLRIVPGDRFAEEWLGRIAEQKRAGAPG